MSSLIFWLLIISMYLSRKATRAMRSIARLGELPSNTSPTQSSDKENRRFSGARLVELSSSTKLDQGGDKENQRFSSERLVEHPSSTKLDQGGNKSNAYIARLYELSKKDYKKIINSDRINLVKKLL